MTIARLTFDETCAYSDMSWKNNHKAKAANDILIAFEQAIKIRENDSKSKLSCSLNFYGKRSLFFTNTNKKISPLE